MSLRLPTLLVAGLTSTFAGADAWASSPPEPIPDFDIELKVSTDSWSSVESAGEGEVDFHQSAILLEAEFRVHRIVWLSLSGDAGEVSNDSSYSVVPGVVFDIGRQAHSLGAAIEFRWPFRYWGRSRTPQEVANEGFFGPFPWTRLLFGNIETYIDLGVSSRPWAGDDRIFWIGGGTRIGESGSLGFGGELSGRARWSEHGFADARTGAAFYVRFAHPLGPNTSRWYASISGRLGSTIGIALGLGFHLGGTTARER